MTTLVTRRRSIAVPILGIGFAAVLVLSGCGSKAKSTATGSSSSSVKAACDLFTSDAAATALGGPVSPGVQTQPNPNETVCKYTRTDGTAFGTVSSGTWDVVSNKDLKVPPITGLGDEAYGSDTFGISVRKGSNGFNVTLATATGDFSGAAADSQSAANLAADQATAQALLANF